MAGIRTPQPINKAGGDGSLPSMEEVMPESYDQLMQIQQTLEKHYRDMQDIEFTIRITSYNVCYTKLLRRPSCGSWTGRGATGFPGWGSRTPAS